MNIIPASKFAELAKVSRAAISKAPPSKIHKEPDGKIDTDHPINAMYLAEHGHANPPKVTAPKKSPAKAKPEAPPKKPDRVPDAEDAAFQKEATRRLAKREAKAAGADPIDDLGPAERKAVAKTIADLMGDTVNLDREKKVADIALKKVLEAKHAFALAKAKGLVIDKEVVRQTASAWNASLGQNVMRVPKRTISRLWALARSGAELREGELMLERELSKAVSRALEGVAG